MKTNELKKELEWLESDFCKEWLEKMKFTTRQDGECKYVFLSILSGYKKISDTDFQRLCDALCIREFGLELQMNIWVGGKVDWTMFYYRPDHVNGHETYYCGVVAEDNFSPEDWDNNHDEYWFDKRGYQRNYKRD